MSGPALFACVWLSGTLTSLSIMAGDKETLLSMGFDSSRVECSQFEYSTIYISFSFHFRGLESDRKPWSTTSYGSYPRA
jgi:hypothetical protein